LKGVIDMVGIERLTVTLPADMAALKAEIDRGLADVAQGWIADFDAERIILRGRRLLAVRFSSG
jgi:hypothetical protein